MSGVSRRLVLLSAAPLLAVGVSACSSGSAGPDTASQPPAGDASILSEYDLDGLDAAGVIERLDTLPVQDRPTTLMASIQPQALVLTTADERQTQLPMPEDKVYLSIAPYRTQTHECYYHSLTTCLGELSNTDAKVTVTTDDGQVLVDETRTTYDNGFFGIWVPRGITATVRVSIDGKTGERKISTTQDDDPTCITDLQLH